MNRNDWIALAAEYDAEARKQRSAGNDDAARYWQTCSRAAKDAAKQEEQKHESPIDA